MTWYLVNPRQKFTSLVIIFRTPPEGTVEW